MTTHKTPAAVGTGLAEPRSVEVAPGMTPAEVGTELGGVLEFHNKNVKYHYFRIEFTGPQGAPNKTDKLTGSNKKPVVVHMPDFDSEFDYCIYYYEKEGGPEKDYEGAFKARSCPGCGGK